MDKLFSVGQACKSCGISRATLLRLEERGLLTPAFIKGESGVRRYDTHNISRVMQIKRFSAMGLSYDDIALYYRECGDSSELLERMEMKFNFFKQAYEEVKLRMERKEHLSFEFLDLPRCVCYTKEFRGTTVEDRYWAMYHLYQEAVEKGYRLLASEPLFVINKRTDFIENTFEEKECDYICCVPLEPSEAPETAVVYPACRVFSCLGYGDYSKRAEAFNQFGREIRERGLKPTGYVRVLNLVAPYTGREISHDCYVSRLALPVE